MSELRRVYFFNVRSKSDLPEMERMLKKDREVCNTYSTTTNKHGKPIISLGYDARPNSDWGRYKGHHSQYIFANDELRSLGEALVRKALDFEELCE